MHTLPAAVLSPLQRSHEDPGHHLATHVGRVGQEPMEESDLPQDDQSGDDHDDPPEQRPVGLLHLGLVPLGVFPGKSKVIMYDHGMSPCKGVCLSSKQRFPVTFENKQVYHKIPTLSSGYREIYAIFS